MPVVVNLLDQYERRARFYPVLFVLMPAALGAASWLPAGVDAPGLAGSAVVGIALVAFLGQLARDQGKGREPELFRRWGGKPSVRALSYSAGVFDAATVARFHRKLRELDPALDFPESAEQEAENSGRAHSVYESANELLLSRTRDREKFRLVFEENVNYGYRRNLWAMKSAGILLAVSGLAAGIGRLVLEIVRGQPVTVTAACAAGLCAAVVVLWIVRVRPEWVRVAADAYAKQLAGASQSL
jgi:hypothetical protein